MSSKLRKLQSKTAAPRFPERLKNLKKPDFLVGDPEDFVHMDWSNEWTDSPPTSKRRGKP